MTSAKYRYILFDLGNVLFRFDFGRCYRHWSTQTGLSLAEIKSKFSFDSVYHQYERGQISCEEYHRHVRRLLSVPLAFEDFKAGWNGIFTGVIEETVAILNDAGSSLGFAVFSNTNEMHREFWTEEFAHLLPRFEKIYCSSQIGFRKPDPKGFQHILNDLRITADQLIFVDDLAENVQGAESLGIKSVHYLDPENAALEIRRLIGMIHE